MSKDSCLLQATQFAPAFFQVRRGTYMTVALRLQGIFVCLGRRSSVELRMHT